MTNQITLPRDAEGREIPLDTKTLYSKDGEELYVKEFVISRIAGEWAFRLIEADEEEKMHIRVYYPWQVYIEKPTPLDSWEKLLEDLDNTVEKASSSIYIATPCAWFSDGNKRCVDCPADESPEGDTCGVQLVKNIAARIRKLRGDGE